MPRRVPAVLAADLVVEFLGEGTTGIVTFPVSGAKGEPDLVRFPFPEAGHRPCGDAVQAGAGGARRSQAEAATDYVDRVARPSPPEGDQPFGACCPCLQAAV